MSKRTIFILTCLASGAGASIVACGGGGGSPKSGDIAAELNHAECTAAFRCMSSYTGSDFSTRFGTSESNCETVQAANFDADLEAAIDASLAAGRIKIDSAAKSSCESYFSAAACATLFTTQPPASCNTFAMGTVAIGGTCTTVVKSDGSNGTITYDVGDCVTGAMCDSTTKKCVTATGVAPAMPAQTLAQLLAQH